MRKTHGLCGLVVRSVPCDPRDGGPEDVEPSARANSFGRKRPTVDARPGPAGEQAEEMARVVAQTLAAPKALSDHGDEGVERLERVFERRRLAEDRRIDPEQDLRVLIGGAAEHDAVDIRKMRLCLLEVAHAAIDDNRPVGMRALQLMDG